MSAAVAFLVEAPSDLKVMMLPEASFEGMTVSVAGQRHEAFGSLAKMAAILTETTGIAFEGRHGDEIRLGLVFNCPASEVAAIEVSGSRILVSKANSSATPASASGPTQSSEGRLFRVLSARRGEAFKATGLPGRLATVDLQTHRGVTIEVKARAKEAQSSNVLLPVSTDDFRLDFELDGHTDTAPCVGISFIEEQWALAAEGPARIYFNLSSKDPKLLFLVPAGAKKVRLVQIGPASGALVELPVRLPNR